MSRLGRLPPRPCPDAVALCSHTEKHDEIVKDGTDMLSKILSEQNEQFKSGLFLSVSLPHLLALSTHHFFSSQ